MPWRVLLTYTRTLQHALLHVELNMLAGHIPVALLPVLHLADCASVGLLGTGCLLAATCGRVVACCLLPHSHVRTRLKEALATQGEFL